MSGYSTQPAPAALAEPVADAQAAGISEARLLFLRRARLASSISEAGISYQSKEAIEHARSMLLARKVPLFHHLSETQIEAIVESFIFVKLERDELVYEPGAAATDFWVITKGEVEEMVDGQIPRTIGKNGHFGVRALLLGPGMARTHTVRVSSASAELWQLKQETFDETITGSVREELGRRFRLQDTPVELKDLRFLRSIGKGGFGSVRMVEHRRDAKCRYALKRTRKKGGKRGQKILDMQNRECALLRELDHPLIMLLVETFETPRSMYILSELISGGDLFSALDNIKRLLNQPEVQFYVGSLILVLEFLGDRCIAFRDLKPENVLLDNSGYIKLIDFGTAKKLDGPGARTFTVIGSCQFMAPEVSKNRHGYGTEADIWSLGVMMFEFVCGHLPFGGNDMDDPSGQKIVKAVQENNLEFPKWYTDRIGKHLIRGMMRKDPAQRMGAEADGFMQLKGHEYLRLPDSSNSLFDSILGRQLEPPFQIADGTESYQIEEEEDDEDDDMSVGEKEDLRMACTDRRKSCPAAALGPAAAHACSANEPTVTFADVEDSMSRSKSVSGAFSGDYQSEGSVSRSTSKASLTSCDEFPSLLEQVSGPRKNLNEEFARSERSTSQADCGYTVEEPPRA